MLLSDKELSFQSQSEVFLQKALQQSGFSSLDDVPDTRRNRPVPLLPIQIQDYRQVTSSEIDAVAESYFGKHGVTHFIVLNPNDRGKELHPLTELAKQLSARLPLKYPVTHPMEGHSEATSRFGQPDGTLKIYDLEGRDGSSGYREQAETAEMFDAHNDGLGYGGAVEAFILYADSAPMAGGYTYFQNVVLLSLQLARIDREAFNSLFLPDAICALRPRGKGAIRVSSPVLFVNEQGNPQVFLRLPSGEYQITWREGLAPLDRAAEYLNTHCQPFSTGSSFVHLSQKGSGCIGRNHWAVHGRTPFLNGANRDHQRVLARKWFMCAPEHAQYKHVPGMHIHASYASIFPDRFGPERLVGDWNFDPTTGTNVRRR